MTRSTTARLRRATAGALSAGLVAGALTAVGVATATPAQAAPIDVTHATFAWELNDEVNAGAYAPGTWNLMSAGKVKDPGEGAQTLTAGDQGATWSNGATAGWAATAGNVTIQDKAADGSYAPTTFDGTRRNSAGQLTSGGSTTVVAETRMLIRNGVGTLDPATDSASLQWDGDATVLFYSGLTFFYLSDPAVSLQDGSGTVTATLSGFATSMDDQESWDPIPERQVTLATLSGVDVTADGLVATPDYREVRYDAPAGTAAQVRTGAHWGAFPQEFVDFQQLTGQSPYWYSTGSAVDSRKVAKPISVSTTAKVTASRTRFLPSGAHQVTVHGTGFDPELATGVRPPLMGKPAGTYVAFGKFAANWRPSADAASATRVNSSQNWAVRAEDMATIGGPAAGAVELRPDGTFTATLSVDKAAIDAAVAGKANAADLVNYGIYTYAGSGAKAAAYETYTPVTFAKASPTVRLSAPRATYGSPATATVTVTSEGGSDGTVTLSRGTAEVGTATLSGGRATFSLSDLRAGSYPLTASYSGSGDVEPGSATATLTVAKAASTVRVKLAKAPTRAKAGKAKVTVVTKPAALASGKVKLVLRTSQGKKVRQVQAGLSKKGVATAKLPRLGKGRYRLVVSYAGTADVAAGTKTITLRVR